MIVWVFSLNVSIRDNRVEILLAASCYGNRDKLRQHKPVLASRLHYKRQYTKLATMTRINSIEEKKLIQRCKGNLPRTQPSLRVSNAAE